MNHKPDKKNRWILDVLLLVGIAAMGLFVYYRISQMLSDREQDADGSSPETINQPTSFPTDTLVESYKSDQQEQEIEAQHALDFQLVNLNGNDVSLSDFLGTPVMVNFWATWCPPCRAEMPLIQEFAAEHQGDFVVLAVNVGEEKPIIESFVEAQNLDDLIFLLDPTNSVASLYRVPGFPTSLFIDADGMLQAVHIGEVDRDLMINYLAKIGVE
jgi:thiol-disulfide isomerase/thioredoxin